MGDHWFKPKTHGYGAAPTNWKGWALTLGYVAAAVIVSLALLVQPAPRFGLWIVVLIALTVAFLWLCKIKTDGEWKWRWGGKE